MTNYLRSETMTPEDQDGIANLAGDTWNAAAFYSNSATLLGGIRFTSTAPADSICESGSLTLYIQQAAWTVPGPINLHFLPTVSAGVWNNAAVAAIDTYTDNTVISQYEVPGTEVQGDAVLFTFDYSQLTTMHQVTRQQDWDGTLMFYISNPGVYGGAPGGVWFRFGVPVLTMNFREPPFFGLDGKQGAHSRADMCPRCGTFVVREQLVQDGFSSSTMVCSDCYDPEEPDAVRLRPPASPIND